MKKHQSLLYILLLLFITSSTFAQHDFVLQNMPQIPQASFQNPAQQVWMKGYFSIPVISGIAVNASTGGLSLKQLGYKNGWDITQITSEELHISDKFSGNVATTILGVGFKVKSSFFNLKISEHVLGEITYPKQAFELLQDYYNQYYTIGPDYALDPVSMDFAHYRSYQLGYNHRFKRFSLGANVKYLQGITSIRVKGDDFGLLFDEMNGTYTVAGTLEGFATGTETYSEGNFSGLKGGSGNHGIALDLGAIFYLTPKIEFSFAATNLGSITWKKNISHAAILDESSVFEIGNLGDVEGDIEGRLEPLLTPSTESTPVPYKTSLRQAYSLGGKYYFKPQLSIAATFHHDRRNDENNNVFSLAVNTQFKKIAGLSLAVSKYNKENIALGAGLNINLGFIQLYAVSDNLTWLLSTGKANRFHAKAGINLIFDKLLRTETIPKMGDGIAMAEKPRTKKTPVDSLTTTTETPPVATHRTTEDTTTESPTKNTPQKPVIDKEKKTAVVINKPELTPGHFGLDGFIKEIGTETLIPAARISIFKIKSDEVQVLNYTKKVAEGNFSTSLSINHAYKVLIFKKGYEAFEMTLDSTEAFVEQWYTNYDFFLTPEVTVITPKPIVDAADITADFQTETAVVEDKIKKVEAAFSSESAPEITITEVTEVISLSMKKSTSLRNGPDHTNKVLRRLRTGQKVELLEKTNKNWWKVKFGDQTGWVKASALEKN